MGEAGEQWRGVCTIGSQQRGFPEVEVCDLLLVLVVVLVVVDGREEDLLLLVVVVVVVVVWDTLLLVFDNEVDTVFEVLEVFSSKIVDGKLNTYDVEIDQPARFGARVIVSGNCRDSAPEERYFTLRVSTRMVVPLCPFPFVASELDAGAGTLPALVLVVESVLEFSGVPKQP